MPDLAAARGGALVSKAAGSGAPLVDLLRQTLRADVTSIRLSPTSVAEKTLHFAPSRSPDGETEQMSAFSFSEFFNVPPEGFAAAKHKLR
jgi:hypothetical protein